MPDIEPNAAAAATATATATMTTKMIDETYEFSAPRFYDFIKDESDDDKRQAELWFDAALPYAPSPFMPRIKAGRSFTVESMCDFSEAEEMQKNLESSSELKANDKSVETKPQSDAEVKVDIIPKEAKDESNVSADKSISEVDKAEDQSAKKIESIVRNPSALKQKSHLQSSQTKNIKPSSVKREKNGKIAIGTPNLAQENQAIKRQKLDGGRSRQILNPKPQMLHHKSKLGHTSGSFNLSSSTATMRKEDRKVYVRESAAPFVSMAEMMKRFQSSTRDLSMQHVNGSLSQMKPKLTLTRPKEPEFETSQRVRSVRVKSTAELEEEMMAKIPKFKARPLNKKILEAPSLPTIPRSTPQPPEFQEFHLETMARANQNAEMASVASTEVSRQNNQGKSHHLTEPKTPVLHTSLRARPPRVKSSFEIEQEELERIPKFKAKPLNKKIFESKGDLGVFCNAKKNVTKPQEFHFATNERIPPPPSTIFDIFDKNPIPRNTIPNPFHLHTEERGAEKERKFITEVWQKQLEEERARVPKANPYPYTTDYPVIPPKPEPKQCTKPEPFQLESLVRHEEELQRDMEERQRLEKEAAQIRLFKAQPILKEDPIPVPEKVRKPLTQVQQFNLHIDHRAIGRAEFDQKVREKEIMYKRYREESDAARMVEEEKALKQLRRTLVPHARPVPNFEHPFCPKSVQRNQQKQSRHIYVCLKGKKNEG
ncbi:protein TPX2 [Prunus yedoensis var. nudiflora]|uniref:Protein TPX2 n=1 Tax=Prunus yedoensis var. nudiflora TaxID=2094558 RepID=A0A314UIV9_PRUYE|nr:protein TPX2 [Prunus yedoensis var. nudiflora]